MCCRVLPHRELGCRVLQPRTLQHPCCAACCSRFALPSYTAFGTHFPKREQVDVGQLITMWPRRKDSTEFRRHTRVCGNRLPVARAIFQAVSVNQSGAVTILPVKFLFSNECFPMTNSTWNLYLQHYSYVYMHIYVCVYV